MIKLLVPLMPKLEQILPYFEQIDRNRWYTNFGHLVGQLEARLSTHYDGAQVVTTNSGTSALHLAYALEKQRGASVATIPALTFPATALAAKMAGLCVTLADVDPDTWSNGTVAAYGLPANGAGVIDAAGAFGEQKIAPGQIGCFSLHATKVLGAGEGGYIVTHKKEDADQYRRMTNFGFEPTAGDAAGFGTNAKLSEYHAAVALASLDNFDRNKWLQLHDWYDHHLPPNVTRQQRPRGVYPVLCVLLPCAASEIQRMLASAYIETRRWYSPPLYRHDLFADDPRKYPITEYLSEHLLGLPYHLFLTEQDVAHVCRVLKEAIEMIAGRNVLPPSVERNRRALITCALPQTASG